MNFRFRYIDQAEEFVAWLSGTFGVSCKRYVYGNESYIGVLINGLLSPNALTAADSFIRNNKIVMLPGFDIKSHDGLYEGLI